MAPDFARRSTASEWMDADDIDYGTFRDCLRDLARVNVVTLAHRPTLSFLEGLRRAGRLELGRPVRIVDAGAGYGDLLRAIGRWARRSGVAVELTGVDLNPWSAKAAQTVKAEPPISWRTASVFDTAEDCDVVVSSLFTHHLDNGQVVEFLRWMETRAALGWFVNDLHRHPVAYYGFALMAQLARWHPFVRHDGPVSIARAFIAEDWRRLLRRADLADAAQVRWRFPFRICVSRVRTP